MVENGCLQVSYCVPFLSSSLYEQKQKCLMYYNTSLWHANAMFNTSKGKVFFSKISQMKHTLSVQNFDPGAKIMQQEIDYMKLKIGVEEIPARRNKLAAHLTIRFIDKKQSFMEKMGFSQYLRFHWKTMYFSGTLMSKHQQGIKNCYQSSALDIQEEKKSNLNQLRSLETVCGIKIFRDEQVHHRQHGAPDRADQALTYHPETIYGTFVNRKLKNECRTTRYLEEDAHMRSERR